MFGRRSKELYVAGIVAVAILFSLMSGCQCEEDLPPPKPKPILDVIPRNWTIVEKLIPGQKAYVRFKLKNKKKDSEPLEIKSIKLAPGSSPQFKLITQSCPDQFKFQKDPQCKETDCVIYDHKGKVLCVPLPLSLPVVLEDTKQAVYFAVEYTPTTQAGVVPKAKILITSNTDNDKGKEFIDTEVLLVATMGDAIIEIVGKKLIPTGDRELFMKLTVEQGKTAEEEVIIRNLGDAELSFNMKWQEANPQFDIVDKDGKSAIGKQYKADVQAKAPQNSQAFKIKFTPKECGTHKVRLAVHSNAITKKLVNGFSSNLLFIKVEGKSPTEAEVNPVSLVFDKVNPGDKAVKKFTVEMGAAAMCNLKIFSVSIGQVQGQPPPQSFSIGKLYLDGSEVPQPTKSNPVELKKGQKLEIEVVYAPQKAGGELGVVMLETNDPDLDPNQTGVVNLTGGTTFNLPPFAKFSFICAQPNSTACKYGQEIPMQMYLSGEKSVKIELDPSKSYDKDGKIVKYQWEMQKKPSGSLAKISDVTAKKPWFKVDMAGKYTVKLTVTDDKGKTGQIALTLQVDP